MSKLKRPVPPSESAVSLPAVEKALGYRFKKKNLLTQALTHRSFSNEKRNQEKGGDLKPLPNNERLEFMGDSVLDLIVSQLLYEHLDTSSEGHLSKTLASLINEKSLAAQARKLGLGEALQLGKGERLTGGHDKDSILADAFEALMAAIYLDGGLKPAAKYIRVTFAEMLTQEKAFIDYKTSLQEKVQQTYRTIPNYKVIGQTGKDHEKQFEIHVSVKDQHLGSGVGKNKKAAEQKAAQAALQALEKNTELKGVKGA